jgi:hypothetical protein
MGLFSRNDDLDAAASETDRFVVIKIVLALVFGIVIIGFIIYFGYNQYQNMVNKNITTNQTNINQTVINATSNESDLIEVNFTDFNLTVEPHPEGIYYFSTREKVIGELCYMDNKKVSCSKLTNEACAEKKCVKDIDTKKVCYVNNKEVDCPKGV